MPGLRSRLVDLIVFEFCKCSFLKDPRLRPEGEGAIGIFFWGGAVLA